MAGFQQFCLVKQMGTEQGSKGTRERDPGLGAGMCLLAEASSSWGRVQRTATSVPKLSSRQNSQMYSVDWMLRSLGLLT